MRPLDLGELLDAAFRVYTRNALTFLKIVAVVILPLQLLSALLLLSTIEDPNTITGFEETTDDDLAAVLAGNVGASLLGGIAFVLTTAACVKAVADAWLGAKPEAGPSLSFAAKHLGALIWVSIIAFFGLILGFVALILPGIWLSVAWALAYPALLLEGARGSKALGRSFRLVRKRWWPTFGRLIVAYLVAGIAQGILAAIFVVPLAVSSAGDSLLATVALTTVANTLATMLTTPFMAAIVVLMYFDLRVRKEGLDLQLLADHIGAPAPAWPQQPAPQQHPAPGQWPQQHPAPGQWPQQQPAPGEWPQQPPQPGAAPAPAPPPPPPPPPDDRPPG